MTRRNRPTIRWLFVLAGLAATAVALIRAIAGGSTDLAPLGNALAGNDFIAVVGIDWHALTALFAILAQALLIAARSSPDAARAACWPARSSAARASVAEMVVTAQMTGSPFTHSPVDSSGGASIPGSGARLNARRDLQTQRGLRDCQATVRQRAMCRCPSVRNASNNRHRVIPVSGARNNDARAAVTG
jgi:hypothetical protein